METMLEFLLDKAPLIGIAIFLIVLVSIIVYKATMYHASIQSTKKKVETLPCAEHSQKIEVQSIINKEIEVKMEFISNGIASIIEAMKSKNGIITDPFTKRNSPLSLTKEGVELVNRLGISDMINSNWDKITTYIGENLSSNNPYDIEHFIMEHIIAYPLIFIDASSLDKIKFTAYNEGFPLLSYMNVIAILIRDRFFDENGINIDDMLSTVETA